MNAYGGWKNIPKVIAEATEILSSVTKMTQAAAEFGDSVTHLFDKEDNKTSKVDDELDRRFKKLSSSLERPSRFSTQEWEDLLGK